MKALTFTIGLAVGLPLGMLLPNLWLTLTYVGAVSTLAFLFWQMQAGIDGEQAILRAYLSWHRKRKAGLDRMPDKFRRL